MAMSITDRMVPDGGGVYYTDAWMATVEQHLPYLKSLPTTKSMPIVAADTIKYQFDLFGLLLEYSVPPGLHFICMRLNGLNAPTDYVGQLNAILVPDVSVIQQLVSVHNGLTTSVKKIA